MLAGTRYDVVDCGQWPYFHLFAAKAFSILRRTRFVTTWYEVWRDHWLEHMGKGGIFGELAETAFCWLPQKIVAVSEMTRRDLVELGVKLERAVMIPNGIDHLRIQTIPLGSNKTHLAYCGRLKNHKNVQLFIQAIA